MFRRLFTKLLACQGKPKEKLLNSPKSHDIETNESNTLIEVSTPQDRKQRKLPLLFNIKGKDIRMKKVKKKIIQATNLDAIKAMRRGGREAEMELLGPGFHSHNKIHKSHKIYTRKKKHKGSL